MLRRNGSRDMQSRGLRFWGVVSAALHAGVLLAILLDLAARRFEEPREQAIAVEVVADLPPEMAQGDVPAPRPAPDPVPLPPADQPPTPEPTRVTTPSPPPPPPPPPPAPAPPQVQAQPRPTPAPAPPPPARELPLPPAPIAEAPTPTPPPPSPQRPPERPQQVAQATPPTPRPPAASQAESRPLPLPPPPVPPPPEPAREAGTGQTPPVQRPQERSQSVLNTLERLRQQQQERPPTARATPPQGAPQQGGGTPAGTAALTAGEIRGLADQISECWSVDAGAPNISEIVVELRVQLDGQGNVRNVVPARGIPADPRARAVYESARRALLAPQCNPLKVPANKLQTLMASTFRFNPRGLVR